MPRPLILASGSEIRARLLRQAAVPFDVRVARVDEDAVRAALEADTAPPRDVADTLAELKALRVSEKMPEALVLGADQVLVIDGRILAKPRSPEEAVAQIGQLSGKRHTLLSAVVACEGGRPVWRHMGEAHLTMRPLGATYVQDYVTRNWDSIRHSVGGYKIEEEGIRLFSRIDGDYFTILGLPLVPVLSWLTTRDILPA